MATAVDLSKRIQSGLATVRRWEADPSLLAECRSQIPFKTLCPEQFYQSHQIIKNQKEEDPTNNSTTTTGTDNPYVRPDDEHYDGDDLLLKRMTLYFQKSMTWVNNPPCQICGCKDTKLGSVTGPMSDEEREGQASRVERYYCPSCDAVTTSFPRYNNPRTLLKTRQGRCGEYANLFGLFCRAAGFETRYILDFTDHVWVEVWSNRLARWIMADGCEGQIDEASMYEHGWGKKLNYILAFTTDSVTDVTRRYTRKFTEKEFQERRRSMCPGGEIISDMTILQVNEQLRSNLKPARIDLLNKRHEMEQVFFRSTETLLWDQGSYNEGRISGSLAWRVSRGEAQDEDNEGTKEQKDDEILEGNRFHSSTFYHVESFHPSPYNQKECTIVISAPSDLSDIVPSSPTCITVSGVPCGVGLRNSISIVIIDEKEYCILQSRSFSDWVTASQFLDIVPDDRIVSIHADIAVRVEDIKYVSKRLAGRLGGLDPEKFGEAEKGDKKKHLLFVGQLNHFPKWTACVYDLPGKVVTVRIQIPTDFEPSIRLHCENDTIPQTISSRLPEEVMKLDLQKKATECEKQTAVLGFLKGKGCKENGYVGFCTKENAPIYLITREAFPLQKCGLIGDKQCKNSSYWKTFHFLPESILSNTDGEIGKHPNQNRERAPTTVPDESDISLRIKKIFSELVANGTDANVAAAQAIKKVTEENKGGTLGHGTAQGEATITDQNDDGALSAEKCSPHIVQIAKKYVDNVHKDPSAFRFRSIRLTNKIFDGITSSTGGVDQARRLGFSLYCDESDFMAYIPLSVDLNQMKNTVHVLLKND